MNTGVEILSDPICEAQVTIRNANGLHMRPAMQFVDLASTFSAEITVSNKDTFVDGKSIMQMTMLAATPGTVLNIKTAGADAADALEALRELVEKKMFDEPIAD